jgi:peptidyl-prolyl cis-trans isomerase D
MREYFRSLKFILVIIIVAFIVTSVVYFGTGAITGGKHNVIATVNGEEIPVERFRRGQANLIRAYEGSSKQRLTPEDAERLGINQQVINDLVRDAVIVQGAEREGVQVTDEELRARIQEIREFQVDGRFSHDQYLRLLRLARFEPADFESEMRRQIVREKMESLVTTGAKVSDAELREAYAALNERVRAAWARVEVEPLMAGVSVADEDLEPYVKAHQAQFTRPERRRIQYVVFNPAL